MGKCCCCGEETGNAYTYYKGTVLTQSMDGTGYMGFETLQDYACSRCYYTDKLNGSSGAGGNFTGWVFGLCILVALSWWLVPALDTTSYVVGGLTLLVAAYVVMMLIKIRTDRRVSRHTESAVAHGIIYFVHKQDNLARPKIYFTPQELKELKKKNGL